MPSLRTTLLAAAAALVATVHADYYIKPDSVPLGTRQSWCDDEKSTCPLICENQAQTGADINSCDPDTLSYGCLCGDGSRPNVSEYTLTLPYFVCTEWGSQCITNCNGDNTCASDCRSKHPCGARDPNPHNLTANSTSPASTSASPTVNPTQIFSGPADSSSAASRGPPLPLEVARVYGTAGMLGLFCLGFVYLL